jgi:quercetin dioxygenase-like cupin family protein
MNRSALPLALALVLSSHSHAQQPASAPAAAHPLAIELDKIPWQKNPDGSGRELATVVGDRKQPGLYIQLVRWPAHTTAKAHSHPDDRYAVVLSGTFYHGFGEKFDASKLERRPSGSFFTEPARLRHFGMTKDEGTVLYFVGTGPSTNDDIAK